MRDIEGLQMTIVGRPRIGWVKFSTIVIAPFLIALATQFLRPVLFGDAASPPLYWFVLVAMSVAWATFMLIGADADYQKQVKADERLEVLLRRTDDISGRITSLPGATYVGFSDSLEVLNSIRSQLPQTKLVRNSLVGMPEAEVYEEQVSSVYAEFFAASPRGRWLDLASFAELFGSRFRQKLPKSVGKRHVVKSLRHSVPLVNCTVLTRNDDTEVAYFGWSFVTPKDSAPVFRTEDPKLVALFRDYFDMLWANRTTKGDGHISYANGRGQVQGIDVVDRFGRWVTVATVRDDKGYTVESYAVIDIDLTANPKVEGTIFLPDLTVKGTLEANDAYATTNRIDFDYPAYPGEAEPSGRCQYRFTRHGGKDIFTGYFVNDRSRTWKDVVGLKVEGGPRKSRHHEAPSVTLQRHRAEIDQLREQRSVDKATKTGSNSTPLSLP